MSGVARRRVRVLVRGAVQSVGFRPFVYRRSTALGLAGWVGNSPEGVTIEAEGAPDRVAALIGALDRPPPNAVIAAIETREIVPRGGEGFAIRASEGTGARTAAVLPDLATCSDCLDECSIRRSAAIANLLSTAPSADPATPSSRTSPSTTAGFQR